MAPGATIMRPADVFGPEDRFLNLFAQLHGRLPRVPLVEGGTARVQPLFVQVRSGDSSVTLGSMAVQMGRR